VYPVHLILEGRSALVVGGGPVAAARARGLLEAGARVRVVAREVGPEMADLTREAGVSVERREFLPADLDGASLVVAATDDVELHRRIFGLADARGLLVSCVDAPEQSNWIAPAVLRRGELIVTVSTSGAAPAFAARLRDELGKVVGEEYGRVLDRLREIRRDLRARYPVFEERRTVWRRLLDEQVLPALARGETPVLDPAGEPDAVRGVRK